MSRALKPGDVIAFRSGANEYRGIIDTDGRPYTTDQRAQWCKANEFTDLRHLVVIDLEFPRTVVKHLRMAAENDAALTTLSWLADRIAEQAGSLDEPTDPKARVTDRRENIWRLLADGDWVCTSGPDVGEYIVWWQLAERGPLSVEVAS